MRTHASCSFDLLVSTLICSISLYSSSLSTSSPSECGLTAPVPEPKPETQIKLCTKFHADALISEDLQ